MRVALILALLAAAAVAVAWNVPAAAPRLAVAGKPPVRGAIHVHTTRSDGMGTTEDVAEAAASAGLSFVVTTDHGDGTRTPDAPRFVRGVLMIDATEITTPHGHLVALAMSPSPYPLAGEPRDVLEDVHRLGGVGFIAHPASPKPSLAWSAWDAPFDGLEWLNLDSEWRDEPWSSRGRALLAYPFRPAEAAAATLDRPDSVLRRWDGATQTRPLVAIAAADAHGGFGIGTQGERETGIATLRLPAYDVIFRTVTITVSGIDLPGDAAADALAIMSAIRAGRVHSSVDALAGPVQFEFTAASGPHRARQGEHLRLGGPVASRVVTNAAPGARIVLLRNGEAVSTADGPELHHDSEAVPGVYRVEMHWPQAPGNPTVPWVVSNPIYVGMEHRAGIAEPPTRRVAELRPQDGGAAANWSIETSASARGALDSVAVGADTELLFRYALGGRADESPFAAVRMPADPDLRSFDRLLFTARSLEPMRLPVQLRSTTTGTEHRWRRSIFIDSTERRIAVFLRDMTPVADAPPAPQLDTVDSVLFVVDTVNTPIGSAGRVWIDDVGLAR